MTGGPLDDPRLVTALEALPGWSGRANAERIGTGFGFGAAVWLVRDASGNAVVAKVEDPAGTRRALAAHEAVGERLATRVPAVLDGWVDEDADRGVIVFEYVGPAVQGDVLRPASVPQAEALIDFVAALHTIPASDGLPPFEATRWTADRWTDRVVRAASRLPDLVGPRTAWLLDGFPPVLEAALDRLEVAPPVLVHGDFHLDNVLWRPGVVPVVLDWSDAGVGPASRDLLVLVGGGIADEHRPAMLARYGDGVERDAGEVAAELRDAAHWLLRGTVGWAASDERMDAGSRMAAVCEAGLQSLFGFLSR